MAHGDDAAAAGLTVFPSTQSLDLGYDNDNVRGDDIAHEITARTAAVAAEATARAAADTALGTASVATSRLSGTITNNISSGDSGTCAAGTITAGKSTGAGGLAIGGTGKGITGLGAALFTSLDATGAVTFDGLSGSSSGTSVQIVGSTLFKFTSSKRYKHDIETAPALPVLDAEVVIYKDNLDDSEHVGVIAEQLVEVGLGQFVHFEDGEPDSVNYGQLAVALIPIIRNQQHQIDALVASVTELMQK